MARLEADVLLKRAPRLAEKLWRLVNDGSILEIDVYEVAEDLLRPLVRYWYCGPDRELVNVKRLPDVLKAVRALGDTQLELHLSNHLTFQSGVLSSASDEDLRRVIKAAAVYDFSVLIPVFCTPILTSSDTFDDAFRRLRSILPWVLGLLLEQRFTGDFWEQLTRILSELGRGDLTDTVLVQICRATGAACSRAKFPEVDKRIADLYKGDWMMEEKDSNGAKRHRPVIDILPDDFTKGLVHEALQARHKRPRRE